MQPAMQSGSANLSWHFWCQFYSQCKYNFAVLLIPVCLQPLFDVLFSQGVSLVGKVCCERVVGGGGGLGWGGGLILVC